MKRKNVVQLLLWHEDKKLLVKVSKDFGMHSHNGLIFHRIQVDSAQNARKTSLHRY